MTSFTEVSLASLVMVATLVIPELALQVIVLLVLVALAAAGWAGVVGKSSGGCETDERRYWDDWL